jgi:hypothetical protein
VDRNRQRVIELITGTAPLLGPAGIGSRALAARTRACLTLGDRLASTDHDLGRSQSSLDRGPTGDLAQPRSTDGVASSSLPALPLIVETAKFTHVNAPDVGDGVLVCKERRLPQPAFQHVQQPDLRRRNGELPRTIGPRQRRSASAGRRWALPRSSPRRARTSLVRGGCPMPATACRSSPRGTQGSHPPRRLSLGRPRRRGRRSPVSFH